ncbi:MAG TPA: hypothetical protein VNE63_09455 [Candidatus Acidoferrales bacterium]|nr:hypothetical protein [Candidatus Acidoferrales bacterium]
MATGGDTPRPERPWTNASQEHGSVAVKTLMEEPLAAMPDAEVSVITLTVAPGATRLRTSTLALCSRTF